MGVEEITTKSVKFISPFTSENTDIANQYLKERVDLCFDNIVIFYKDTRECSYMKALESFRYDIWKEKFGNNIVGRVKTRSFDNFQNAVDSEDFWKYGDKSDKTIRAVSSALDKFIAEAMEWHNTVKKKETIDFLMKSKKRWEFVVTKRNTTDDINVLYVEFTKFDPAFRKWIIDNNNGLLCGSDKESKTSFAFVPNDLDLYRTKSLCGEDKFAYEMGVCMTKAEQLYLEGI